jgi:predicted AlkP superfamily pyrophosphatase or phosphodiesterase
MEMKEYSMTCVAPTISKILGLRIPQQATGSIISEVLESLKDIERIAVLAPDALGFLTWKRWKKHMPFLTSLASIHLLVLRSVMPSKTPVNFATIVSGCEISNHRVHTYDDCFQCETLFDIIRKEGWKSAGVGQKDYTGSRLLGRNADICGVGEPGGDEGVEKQILEISSKQNPHFIIAQLGRTDDVFHCYGVTSPKVIPHLKEMDDRLQRLVKHLKDYRYGILILSDHGQHDFYCLGDTSMPPRGTHHTDSDEDCLVPLIWTI